MTLVLQRNTNSNLNATKLWWDSFINLMMLAHSMPTRYHASMHPRTKLICMKTKLPYSYLKVKTLVFPTLLNKRMSHRKFQRREELLIYSQSTRLLRALMHLLSTLTIMIISTLGKQTLACFKVLIETTVASKMIVNQNQII
jgi:hypothetical protein